MGKAAEYREFESLEDYREFFRICQDSGSNTVAMMLPRDDAPGRKLGNVLITDPGHDHNLVKALTDRFADVKWKIAPVKLTEQRRLNTDKKNYRVRLRKHLVADYRKDMKKGAFFPLLVFVADQEFWASGRHRSESAEKSYDAVYALVCEGLTPSQLLFISDTTNRWHSEKWDGDEFANLAYDYHMIDGMTVNNALLRVGLTSKDKDLFQAVLLWRRYPDIVLVGGQGHPLYFPELTKRIYPYLGHFQSGVDQTKELTRKQWGDIIWDKTGTTKKVKAPGDRQLSAYVLENGTRGTYVWAMKGDTVKEKYQYFLKLREKKLALDAAEAAGVGKEVADDEKWVSFVRYWKHFDNAALVNIQQQLDDEWQEESRKLVFRLGLVFGD